MEVVFLRDAVPKIRNAGGIAKPSGKRTLAYRLKKVLGLGLERKDFLIGGDRFLLVNIL